MIAQFLPGLVDQAVALGVPFGAVEPEQARGQQPHRIRTPGQILEIDLGPGVQMGVLDEVARPGRSGMELVPVFPGNLVKSSAPETRASAKGDG